MLKGITYNKPFNGVRKYSDYFEEVSAINKFLEKNEKNVCFEYRNEKEANAAAIGIRRRVAEYRWPIEVSRRKEFVFITRRKKEEKQCTN